MLFNSAQFLVFFAISLIGYYIISPKYRYIWLLICSYFFYMNWNPIYVLLLMFSTIISYVGGLLIERSASIKGKKICLTAVILSELSVLVYFKYTNMFMVYLNKLIEITGHPSIHWEHSVILPVGISFFTLQSLGYLIDVYRRNIYAEKNILRYALFISFFPQLVAGPIERSGHLLKQLAKPVKFSYDNLRRGMLITLYGYFLKVLIADRLSIFVDRVYSDTNTYTGFYIIVATILFTIQIYCDFYGYSTIAKGVAMTMGISLMDNFNAPFYSKSIKEFWSRWHISLSSWFRDYLYFPLGGNRKGPFRRDINLLIVFAVSGLWHGASISFVIWGLLNGLYEVSERWMGRLFAKVMDVTGNKRDYKTRTNKILRIMITYTLFTFSMLFFRANDMGDAMSALKNMITKLDWKVFFDGSMFGLGIDRNYSHVLILAFMLLATVDYLKYRGKNVVDAFFKQNWWFRVLAITGLLTAVLLFGCYGNTYSLQQFIYFQF